eukprot:m51a1_g4360 cad protein, putative (2251) ;mRNA; f:261175-268448
MASIVFADGTRLRGHSFGAAVSVCSEVVVYSGVSDAAQVACDPQFAGRIVVMTFPVAGNVFPLPDLAAKDSFGIPVAESHKIHAAAIVVANYVAEPSIDNGKNLGEWLAAAGVPAIADVDTRRIARIVSANGGKAPAKIVVDGDEAAEKAALKADCLCGKNQTASVALPQTVEYNAGGSPRILAVDCGIKSEQLRALVSRGAHVQRVPCTADLAAAVAAFNAQGVFLSSGAGCAGELGALVDAVRALPATVAVFGVGLGHHVLARSAAAETRRVAVPRRTISLPVIHAASGRLFCAASSAACVVAAAPAGWTALFTSADDQSVMGLAAESSPRFSVQFRPEGCPGAADLVCLFDAFLALAREPAKCSAAAAVSEAIAAACPAAAQQQHELPRKVLVLGAAGTSLGQAAGLDYCGFQALRALRDAGVQTVVVSPNVASSQAMRGAADKVYFVPVTPDYVEQVVEHERPDAVLASFGGAAAMTCARQLDDRGTFARAGVRVLGTPLASLPAVEDRERLAQVVAGAGEQLCPSVTVDGADARAVGAAAEKVGFPVLLHFTRHNRALVASREQAEAVAAAEHATGPLTVQKLPAGWRQVEYELLADAAGNVAVVATLEGIESVSVHRAESTLVCPAATLCQGLYQHLRSASIRIARAVRAVGSCNVLFAVGPARGDRYVLEVSSVPTRSTALASAATGYAAAYVAALLAAGRTLPQLRHPRFPSLSAASEPALDAFAVKMPRWDQKKMRAAGKTEGAAGMKTVGEAMAFGRTIEEALGKAVRMVDARGASGIEAGLVDASALNTLAACDSRVLAIASLLASREGDDLAAASAATGVHWLFLARMRAVVRHAEALRAAAAAAAASEGDAQVSVPAALIRRAKELGFGDRQIARCVGSNELGVRSQRLLERIAPVAKRVDPTAGLCAPEVSEERDCVYLTYHAGEGATSDIAARAEQTVTLPSLQKRATLVVGSGAYRIGSRVEFDWCTASCALELRRQGIRAIVLNNNPSCASTDASEVGRVYMEDISAESVAAVYEAEGARGVVLSVGGNAPLTLAPLLDRVGVPIVGTAVDSIDTTENRYKFSRLLDQLGIDQPRWRQCTAVADAQAFCTEVGYPCIVRAPPASRITVAHNASDVAAAFAAAGAGAQLVVSKFVTEAKEIEVDAVASNGQLLISAISEHVENAGVHSGDASVVFPAVDLNAETLEKVEAIARALAKALYVHGPMNLHLIAKDNQLKVIECNVRASRSFAFVSKTLDLNLCDIATRVMVGAPAGIPADAAKRSLSYVGVKVPAFSFGRLRGVDPTGGVEMASTGEVACFGEDKWQAYLKALTATGFGMPQRSVLLSIGPFKAKHDFLDSARKLAALGFSLIGSPGTADYYSEQGVAIRSVTWWGRDAAEGEQEELNAVAAEVGGATSVGDALASHEVDLVINVPMRPRHARPSSMLSRGSRARKIAVEHSVPLVTDIKCAKMFVEALVRNAGRGPVRVHPTLDCRSSSRIVQLPGLVDVHVHMREPGGAHKEDWESGTAAALAGGITTVLAMPNTDPALTSREALDVVSSIAKAKARCDYGIIAGGVRGNAKAVAAPEVSDRCAALKLYLGQTFVSAGMLLTRLDEWREHVQAWPAHLPICVHAEGQALGGILLLGHLYNRPIHVCHVARREEIELVRKCKEQGMKVTCEVTPHHLFLWKDEAAARGLSAGRSSVRPELGTKDDVDALWENLATIDCFATDHAPHLAREKDSESCPPGFPGLETVLPLLLTAVAQGRLTLDDVVLRMHTNPCRIFGIAPQDPSETYTEVDLDARWTVPEALPQSKAGWTPYAGMQLTGRVKRVVIRNELAFLDGAVIAKPGSGRDVRAKAPAATLEVSKPEVAAPAPVAAPASSSALAVPAAAAGVSPSASPAPVAPTSSALALAHLVQQQQPQAAGAPAEVVIAPLKPLPFAEGDHGLRGQSILGVNQFTKNHTRAIFNVAHEMRQWVERAGVVDLLRGKVLGSIFYEPSTRTSCSFVAAMQRLGGGVISITEVMNSSVKKGESLPDFIRTMEAYTDAIVLRHPEKGSVQLAHRHARKPIINAGDGVGEHPTQALLDTFTIREERGTLNGITVALVGDLKNGRTVHSLSRMLAMYDVKIRYVAPPQLRMPAAIIEELRAKGVQQSEHSRLEEIIEEVDVLYVTRVQKERFASLDEYEAVRHCYRVTPALLAKASEKLIVMHPLPRVDEISPDCDTDPRAVYFRQVEYGMYVRMALLAMILGKA